MLVGQGAASDGAARLEVPDGATLDDTADAPVRNAPVSPARSAPADGDAFLQAVHLTAD
ncbi:hypothetical protein ACFQ9U_30860 [Streptomyces sp. NPDC056568]|uniref:hypothetical protein n=1 Tax=Streptomyces sp. NPDC056568 TaxID=3345866 RepID=UPI0036CC7B07